MGETSRIVSLPAPVRDSATSVEEALSGRRSVRSFKRKTLTLQDLSQLLWAAQGITDSSGFRTAPSAGALYPIEIYLIAGDIDDLPAGLYHFRPRSHELVLIEGGDLRKSVWEAALRQSAVRDAPALFVFTGVFSRTMAKYGKRGLQYVLMEIGHAAQNLSLQAVSMDLGSVPIGAFDDDIVRKILSLDEQTHPLYIVPVGHPEK